MPRRRHRMAPVRRPLPRVLRPLARPLALATGRPLVAAAVLTGVTGLTGAGLLAASLPGAVPADPASAAAPSAALVARDAGARAAGLRVALDLREERTSRDTVRPPQPAAGQTPAGQTPAVTGQLWVITQVSVRSGPSTSSGRLVVLAAGTRVDVTGVKDGDWTQVLTGGRVGWVMTRYLSASKPKPASVPAGLPSGPCPISPDVEPHLTAHARAVYRAVCGTFGSAVSSFGGYRAGDSGDHGAGRALDIMISGAPGLDVARYVQAHARELGVSYVIYQQKIWMAGDPVTRWKLMEDRGSVTANHYDHVHVSVS